MMNEVVEQPIPNYFSGRNVVVAGISDAASTLSNMAAAINSTLVVPSNQR